MLPEWKYNWASSIKFLLLKLSRIIKFSQNINLLDNRIEVFMTFSRAVDDAIEFYGISREDFFDNVLKWNVTEKNLFNQAENLKQFYESWNNEASIQNVCANIINQMIWIENYNICSRYAISSDFIIDYGCGTGSLSIGLAFNKKIKNKLLLLDVPNDVSKFRDRRISKYNLTNVKNENIFEYDVLDKSDLLICLDVLEHLENSSFVFINHICPLLKSGGFMILRAPWRGQLTHIDQAADDFYLNGGRKYLSKYFREVYRLGMEDIHCVYQKK